MFHCNRKKNYILKDLVSNKEKTLAKHQTIWDSKETLKDQLASIEKKSQIWGEILPYTRVTSFI